uniref:Tyr recombinase domain-containing protein n=1 Tax=Thermosporothrix sp. COM3 TaxID=2490863 RepID=A0A455SR98_9CHLR|nr:hypothetical protein KTC_49060 [Thermosporothrix sp. COM3]BBH90220.1 hypothetical protein KTC_49710 [Thermosporothrix sp. COM3]BBH90285.1 hypothetical protein KTC_50360 [Thermosporothrix sp. COM3]
MPKIKKREESSLQIPVQEAVYDFFASPEFKRLRPSTKQEYSQELPEFAAWCASHTILQDKNKKSWYALPVGKKYEPIMLNQINHHVIQCFVEYLQQTHKPSRSAASEISTYTLASYVRVAKRFLSWCLEDEQYSDILDAKSINKIKLPTVVKTIIEVFSPEQLEALFDACRYEESEHLQIRDQAILALLVDTGIRASELVSLTIGNVSLDTKDSYVRVLGKGGKWGEVGMGEKTRRLLQKYIRMFRVPTIEFAIESQLKKLPTRSAQQFKAQAIQKANLFMSRSGGGLTVRGLERLIERLGEWAEIEGVRCTPHTFRHTFAAMFIRNGGDIYTLSKLLRHSSVKVTEEYLKSLKQSEARRGAKSVLDTL